MRIAHLQHVPFEGLGSIASWAQQRGHETIRTRLFAGEKPPALDEVDWLIPTGGPMSVHDEGEFPWLADEKTYLRRAVESGKTILGICLGAQLLAEVLGGRVHPNGKKEIGWFPVRRASCHSSPLAPALPPEMEAFHWHGETFTLPHGAVHLYRSACCENQAFVSDGRLVGIQFHLETTAESAKALVEKCPGDLAPGAYVQSASEILRDGERFAALNGRMELLLDALAAP